MDAYCKLIRKLEGRFYGIEYIHVVRDKNQAADALSKLGSSRAKIPHGIFVQDLLTPSIEEEDSTADKPLDQQLVAMVAASSTTETPPTTHEPDWRIPFIKYLTDGSGYTDRIENERLMRCSKLYLLVDGKLWHKNAKEEILMKCITWEDGEHLCNTSGV